MHQIILTVKNIFFALEGIEVCSLLISKDFNDDIRFLRTEKDKPWTTYDPKKFSGPLSTYIFINGYNS